MAPAAEPAEARTPESYDLTFEVAKYLDRHLVFPLLEYLSQQQSYDAADIERAKLELIEKTNMVDYAVDIYQGLYQTDEARPRARAAGSMPAPAVQARGRAGARALTWAGTPRCRCPSP
jgi:hypothetical protein